MIVARTVSQHLERASWIRRMFEEGIRLKAERGAENVFDFTLGNPEVEPPEEVLASLRRVALNGRPGMHGYMPNAGFPEVRAAIAARLAASSGLPFTAEHVIMTVGSSGAINTVLRALLDPGDEVIVPVPYFAEYPFYVQNHGGRMVEVETGDDFSLRVDRMERAVTERTRAIILNSPNNPAGVVYPREALEELGAMLDRQARPITLISDEPYKALLYDGIRQPEVSLHVRRAVVAHSWSKAQAIAGERIGYLAVSPRFPEAAELINACTFTNRILGFVNAPAIWQWVVAESGEATVDVAAYQRKRDLVCENLSRFGYQVNRPQGAFYVFPRTPIPDDVAFIRLLQKEGILAVPGSGFGRAGYFRLSLTVERRVIEGSLPGFERAMRAARQGLR
ncbi:MAG: pyridoxal phosphate-dependent aminotransferase [Bryobacterales bacterium]|nr:pyridoxal phosphate-dependent aminotransferase [Bryobacterales bacterium]